MSAAACGRIHVHIWGRNGLDAGRIVGRHDGNEQEKKSKDGTSMCSSLATGVTRKLLTKGEGRATGVVVSGCGDYCTYVGGGQGSRTVWCLGLWAGPDADGNTVHVPPRFVFELDHVGPTPRTNKNQKNARRVQSCGSDRQAWPLAQLQDPPEAWPQCSAPLRVFFLLLLSAAPTTFHPPIQHPWAPFSKPLAQNAETRGF